MIEENILTAKTVELLERTIETSSKLKNQIELLVRDQAREHQLSDKALAEHDREINRMLLELQENNRRLLEIGRDMSIKFDMSSFNKLSDQQKESDKYFADAVRDAVQKIDHIISWTDGWSTTWGSLDIPLIGETVKDMKEWLQANKVTSAEKTRGMFLIYVAIIGQIGIFAALIFDKLF